MKTFLISLPRTRSSFLFESLKPYYESKYGLPTPAGHSELFLEWARNIQIHNYKTEESHMSELYPTSSSKGIQMHYVWPSIFNSTKERNSYKIELLKKEKEKGREYNIKGTLNLAENIKDVCDLFKDRKFILTKRKDVESMILSFFFAWESKLFHARSHNLDVYKGKMKQGVTVGQEIIFDYIDWLDQMEIVETYLKENNINHEVVYYEDLKDDDDISEIIKTDEWKQYRNTNDLPIRIDKDYSKLINNYDEVIHTLKKLDAL